jgi:perosamine synthetase
VIVPSLTFAATANAVLYSGGTPIFAEVGEADLLLDPKSVETRVTARTKAIIAVDYAGQPCDYGALQKIAEKYKLTLIADACHSVGGERNGKRVGQLAELTVLSFHPVKQMTTGEGGMVLTNSAKQAEKMKVFRNHGISTDHRQRAESGSLSYEMLELGFNYRLTDIQCALGLSQLARLPAWIKRRNEIAQQYENAFATDSLIALLNTSSAALHARHLFVVKIAFDNAGISRNQLCQQLRQEGVGVNVHYPPLHLHPYYRKRFGYEKGMLPVTERAYEQILSLPMYPTMSDTDVKRVIAALRKALGRT